MGLGKSGHSFPAWKIRRAVNDLNTRFKYRIRRGRFSAPNNWQQCLERNRSKMKKLYPKKAPGTGMAWSECITDQRAKLRRLWDPLELWRLKERAILDKMNAERFTKGMSFEKYLISLQIKKLKKKGRTPKAYRRHHRYGWDRIREAAEKRIMKQSSLERDSEFSAIIRYNLNRLRLVEYSRGWQNCIRVNLHKRKCQESRGTGRRVPGVGKRRSGKNVRE